VFFSIKHDQYLLNYLETGIKSKIDQKQTLFAINSTGFLIQVNVLIREVAVVGERRDANRSSLTFVASIKPAVFDCTLFSKASVEDEHNVKTKPSAVLKKASFKPEFCFIDPSLVFFSCLCNVCGCVRLFV
jgi:hypothetical protein